MKIEKLERNRKKKIIIGVVAFLCLLVVIIYAGSRAKYKVTQSIPLINGTINYKPYDFKMMAMYQANDSGGYTEIDTMPTSGYEINEEKSYCTTDNVNKDTTARIYTDTNGKHVIENLKKNDKCYIWFDVRKLTVTDLIASNNPTSGKTSFTGVSTSNEGLKIGMDDDGTTYYFRGNVTNNWVQFAGFYWRIIRINGDGSIRLIYNGISTTTTGTGTQIGTKAFNTNYNDNAYVGLMYGTVGSNTYADTHSNTNASTILGTISDETTLLGWYKKNIVDAGYSNKISQDAGFCNDRSIANSSQTWWSGDTKKGYGINATAYGPFSRISKTDGTDNSTQTPKFTCTNASTDLFTVTGASKGNKKLTYPVGLITMDEVIYAGGFYGASNSSYYLYTNQNYWTMSPYCNNGYALMSHVISDGLLTSTIVYNTFGVRPVINLSSDVKLTGIGTTDSPYQVS